MRQRRIRGGFFVGAGAQQYQSQENRECQQGSLHKITSFEFKRRGRAGSLDFRVDLVFHGTSPGPSTQMPALDLIGAHAYARGYGTPPEAGIAGKSGTGRGGESERVGRVRPTTRGKLRRA